jgi:hypothetical protein
MNAGFSNLDWLKKQLLANTLASDKSFDAALLAIGKGAAAAMARWCNREFPYRQGIQEIFTADRSFWFTNRPVVSVFSAVELRYFRADAWTDISGQPLSTDESKGYINFGYTLGRNPMQVRLTYNGGYYFNTLEPDDASYIDPGQPAWWQAAPADILQNAAGIDPCQFRLPDDLLLAWLLQCRKVWEAIDKTGEHVLSVGSNTRNPSESLAGLDLIPQVQGMLQPYKRFQLS